MAIKNYKMKRFINSLGIGFLVAMAMLFTRPADAQPRVGVSINFQTFYDQLSPYGEWIDYPEYGYTWRPRVGSDFRPYATNGHWVYTNEYDWMWNSGYEWGWAPFHYGRWFYDPLYGWLWVPGYDWSPAWVTWRGGGDYYGWAPIRPGISISIGFGSYNPPYDYWTFAPSRYMTSRYIGRYYYPYRNNVTIINKTTIINNYGDRGRRSSYYVNGPRRTDVERYTGRISAVSVRSSDKPGRATLSRNSVSVYRPAVSRSSRDANYAPRTVQSYNRNSTASRTTRSSNTSNRAEINNNRNTHVNTTPSREHSVNENRSRTTDADRTQRSAIERSNRTNSRTSPGGVRSEPAERQRDQQSQQRATEMRQRNEAIQRQQRSVETQQRSVEVQQRQAEVEKQRQSRSEAQQRAAREQTQRQSQIRTREVQSQRQSPAPRVEHRSSPSVRSQGNSSDRSSRGGGRSR